MSVKCRVTYIVFITYLAKKILTFVQPQEFYFNQTLVRDSFLNIEFWHDVSFSQGQGIGGKKKSIKEEQQFSL